MGPETTSGSGDPRQRAEQVYAEHLALLDEDESADLTALCAEHPDLADVLPSVHAGCERVARVLCRLKGQTSPIFDRTQGDGAQTGPDIDVASTSEGDRATPSGRLLEHLSAHSPRESRYRLIGEVARGGMGAILRVWDTDLRRMLAMKVVLGKEKSPSEENTLPIDERSLGRFLEEALVTGQLDHPGVVPVHELGVDREGRVFFTMRLVKGRDLRQIYQLVYTGEEGWTQTRALNVLLRVCEALAYAHDKGVVHRDLKPANVMVGRFGEVYVMDWGLARVRGREDHRDIRVDVQESGSFKSLRREASEGAPDSPLVTMDGDILGTPAYMSPEQARGEVEKVDRRSDVYSLGAMLYELLGGQVPYVPPGARVSPRSILFALLEGPPKPLHALSPHVPVELQAICEKAMARDRDLRYPGMLELAGDLRAYLEDRVVEAYETGAAAEFKKWVARNRGMAAALAALVVLVVGASFFVAWLQSNKQEQLSIAYRKLELEQEEKQLLSDVMTARVLEEQVDEHTPDSKGIAMMELWLERFEDIRSRRAVYAAGPDQTPATSSAVTIDELRKLPGQLSELEALLPAVRGRLEVARSLYRRSIEEAWEPWQEAIEDIERDPYYGVGRIPPQIGLVPLHKDPYSGLWEFWHIASGERPDYDEDQQTWVVESGTGMVLVLIPGGEFQMGSPQSEVDRGWNETLHSVEVGPFFLSKFETTQAQWQRAMRANPSQYPPGTEKGDVSTTDLHPVETVSWNECDVFAVRLGLRLPTEEEWEYACRVGAETRFHWGDDIEVLRDKENLADASFMSVVSETAERVLPADWDDGFPVTSPVGSLAPNGFGLHDMHGNVGEWTSSLYFGDYNAESPGEMRELRVARGGNHYFGPRFARAASRQHLTPEYSTLIVGVRLGRNLDR